MQKMEPKRYFLHLSYNGTPFHGWQIQSNATSVQGTIEKALATLMQKETNITGSGRTDTGVHALEQYAHLDLIEPIDEKKFLYQLNALLPASISIMDLIPVLPSAHARFDATHRSYEYRISSVKDPFRENMCLFYSSPLDIEAMNQAAAELLGEQDFKSFSKVKTNVNHFRCSIEEAQWKQKGTNLVFYIRGNRFLRGMVRTIVGTLLDVGAGKIDPTSVHNIIQAKDRTAASRAVSASGLYLTKVRYPKKIFRHQL